MKILGSRQFEERSKLGSHFCGVELVSPIAPLNPRNHIEVTILAQQGKSVLATERCNPEIIRRNWLSGLSQLNVDSRIAMGGLFGNVQHSAVSDQPIQPAPISRPAPGLSDSVAIFADH